MKDNIIPFSEIGITGDVIPAIEKVIKSGKYILGSNTKDFEGAFALKTGMKNAVAVNSGTSALFLSMLAMEIGKNDEVIVTPMTAFPTVEAIIYLGAKPVFVDVDEHTLNIDPDKIEKKITKKTKCIIPVHLYGNPCEMDKIVEISNNYGLQILEDCSQSHFAKYKGEYVGSFGQISAYSFYPSKNLTVGGDGGIVVTNNDKLADIVRVYRNHGRKTKYEHIHVGYNYRFNEIQAAIGLNQLSLIESFTNKRIENANYYKQKLKLCKTIKVVDKTPNSTPVYHLFVIRTKSRNKLADYLKGYNINTGIHYPIPMHLQPAIKDHYKNIHLPIVEKACDEILSLPIFPNLSFKDIDFISDLIYKFETSTID